MIREDVPSPVDGETFNSWCERVLDRKPADVQVWKLDYVASQTKIQTLGRDSNGEALLAVIKAQRNRSLARGIAIAHRKDNQEEFRFVFAPVKKDHLRKVLERVADNYSSAVEDFSKHFDDEENEGPEWEAVFEELARRHSVLIDSS